MKTPLSGGKSNVLPTVGGVNLAPAKKESAASLPSGKDFLSLIAQVYPATPANANSASQSLPGTHIDQASSPISDTALSVSLAPPIVPTTKSSQTSTDESSEADLTITPGWVNLVSITASESETQTSSTSSAANLKSRPRDLITKNSGQTDDALTSSVMAMLIQPAIITSGAIPAFELKSNSAPLMSATETSPNSTANAGEISLPSQPPSSLAGFMPAGSSQAIATNAMLAIEQINVSAQPSAKASQEKIATTQAEGVSAFASKNETSTVETPSVNPAILPVPLNPLMSAATASDPSMVQTQNAVIQLVDSANQNSIEGVSRDGTSVALNRQRMKNSAEKNEIAGRAEKKLPRDGQTHDLSTAVSSATVSKTDSDPTPAKKEIIEPGTISELTAKAASFSSNQAASVEKPVEKSVASAALQVEHVARVVSQEVVTLRQSGANLLAVSVKLDAHTELFLQLSNHSGQMQASIRFERGSADGLANHWSDLQSSLARQNVQLLPLAGSNSNSSSTVRNFSDSNPGLTSDSPAFQQSPGNFRRQTSESPEPALAGNETAATTKTKKAGASALKGWESWA